MPVKSAFLIAVRIIFHPSILYNRLTTAHWFPSLPSLSGLIKQFLKDVDWNELDYLVRLAIACRFYSETILTTALGFIVVQSFIRQPASCRV